MINYAERYQHLLPEAWSEGQVESLLIQLADPPNWPTDDYDDCDATAVEFLEHVACAFAEAADNLTAIADPLAESAIQRIVETAIDDLTAGADSDHVRTCAAIGLGAFRLSLDGFRVSSETTVADAVDFALLEIGRRLCVALDERVRSSATNDEAPACAGILCRHRPKCDTQTRRRSHDTTEGSSAVETDRRDSQNTRGNPPQTLDRTS